ncbi:hypothetical protein BHE74_00043553 [Ensete ventricosum]|nr:hypothetical protein BHE74_00043553 [Ensete ventricosum]
MTNPGDSLLDHFPLWLLIAAPSHRSRIIAALLHHWLPPYLDLQGRTLVPSTVHLSYKGGSCCCSHTTDAVNLNPPRRERPITSLLLALISPPLAASALLPLPNRTKDAVSTTHVAVAAAGRESGNLKVPVCFIILDIGRAGSGSPRLLTPTPAVALGFQ